MILPLVSNSLPAILLMNIRSLRPKIDELSVFFSAPGPDILAICETWLDENVDDSQVILPFYGAPYRCDRRDGRRGGGVCLYIRNSIRNVRQLTMPPFPPQIECLWMLLQCLWMLLQSMNLIFVLLYVPPNLNSSSYRSITDYLIDNADHALDQVHSSDAKIIIAGDTNQFPDGLMCETLGLTQVVQMPTRNKSILDKIFLGVTLTDDYHSPIIGPNFGNADHWTVLLRPIRATPYISNQKHLQSLRSASK